MSVRATLYNDEPSRKISCDVASVRAAKSLATKNGRSHLRTELDEHEGFKVQWWIKNSWGWYEVGRNTFFGVKEGS